MAPRPRPPCRSYAYDPPRFVPQGLEAHCSKETIAFHHLPAGTYKPSHDLYYRCREWFKTGGRDVAKAFMPPPLPE